MLKTIKAWWHNRHSDPGADHRKMVRVGPKLTDIEAFCDELGRLTDDVAEAMEGIDIMLDKIQERVKEIREIREGKA